MKAKDKLIELFTKKHKITNQAVSRYKDTECIILRDIVIHEFEDKLVELKEDIEYRDTVRTRKMRKDLQLYNDILQRTDIQIPDASEAYIKAIIDEKKKESTREPYILNDSDYFVRRVFNNGSWDQGGRYHGGWWQRIPSNLRVCITLNGSKERLIEVDYSGLHIVILYAMEGIDYWKQYGRDYDPYKLDGYEQTDRMRDLLKFVLLTAINASDKQTALSAVQKELNFNPDEYLWVKQSNDIDLSDLIDAFSEKHKPIKKHLYSKIGIQLQNVDSKIAETVINHFTKKGIPILCVHDSFLIDTKHSNELIQIMNDSFTDTVSGISTSSVDVESLMKLKTWYEVLIKYE
jgi:hypothetical protein